MQRGSSGSFGKELLLRGLGGVCGGGQKQLCEALAGAEGGRQLPLPAFESLERPLAVNLTCTLAKENCGAQHPGIRASCLQRGYWLAYSTTRQSPEKSMMLGRMLSHILCEELLEGFSSFPALTRTKMRVHKDGSKDRHGKEREWGTQNSSSCSETGHATGIDV